MSRERPNPRSEVSSGVTTSRRALNRGLLVAAVAAFVGCEPVRPGPSPPPSPPPPSRRQIGRMTEVGGHVTLTSGPARAGAPVFDSDKVSTASDGHVTVDLFGYGSVELGDNTDPRFSIRQDGCLLIHFFFGVASLDGSRFCLVEPGGAELFFSTRALVHAAPPQTVVMVLQGSVRVRGVVVGTNQRLVITRGTPGRPEPLNPRELNSYLQRFRRRPTPSPGKEKEPPPPGPGKGTIR